MNRLGYFFGENPVDADVTAPARSNGLYCPALSTIAIHIAGTGSVNVISNPFGDSAKDKILSTLTASGEVVIASASIIFLDVTAVSGTVTAKVIFNQEVE